MEAHRLPQNTEMIRDGPHSIKSNANRSICERNFVGFDIEQWPLSDKIESKIHFKANFAAIHRVFFIRIPSEPAAVIALIALGSPRLPTRTHNCPFHRNTSVKSRNRIYSFRLWLCVGGLRTVRMWTFHFVGVGGRNAAATNWSSNSRRWPTQNISQAISVNMCSARTQFCLCIQRTAFECVRLRFTSRLLCPPPSSGSQKSMSG